MKKGLIFTVMLVTVLALGYSQTTLSGTYRYSTNAYVTFTGNAFKGLWNATTLMSGTYSVSGARLTLNITDGPKAKNTWTWTITDANTLKDQDGDTWKKEGAGGTAQTRTTPAVEYNVNNMATWIEAVGGVRSGGNNKAYVITVTNAFSVPVSTGSTFGPVSGVTITIQGDGTLTPSGDGCLLILRAGQTVVLKGDITLRGRDDTFSSVVIINEKGAFRMEDNSTVTSNYSSGVEVNGGTFTMSGGTISDNNIGVYFYGNNSRNTFTMSGGTISGNRSYGVSIKSGTFTMKGGAISGNRNSGVSVINWEGSPSIESIFLMEGGTISDNTADAGDDKGGGVYVGSYKDGLSGTFNMNGGTISGNKAKYNGGGVYIGRGEFTMKGGTISDNTATWTGGGVYIESWSSFVMHDGTISGNTSSGNGGGVYNTGSYSGFTMSGGTISGNTAISGGGVYVDYSFTMSGGTISGNISRDYGGGVYYANGTFTKTGGTISGNNATETDRNTANKQGYVVYNGRNENWRNATAGPRINTDTYGFWLND